MSYSYQIERPKLFTEEGQVMFIAIRDNAKKLFAVAGCARFMEITRGVYGDSWLMLACLDRLIELKEIREVTAPGSVVGQHRIFVAIEKEA